MSKSIKPRLKSHNEMIADWMQDPEFKAAYDALEDEQQLLREMLHARKRLGLTQADVAAQMNTKAPAIARLETFTNPDGHSPSISTLRNYAKAVGCRLEIHLKPTVIRTFKEKRKAG
jgi:ribosome-binding protein aMBF1 (putative translation factor)